MAFRDLRAFGTTSVWSQPFLADKKCYFGLRFIDSPTGTELVEQWDPQSPKAPTSGSYLRFPWTTPAEESVHESEDVTRELGTASATLKFAVGSFLAAQILRGILRLARVGLRRSFDQFYTRLMDGAAIKSTNYSRIRKAFLETEIFHARPNSNHSHATSASVRTTADRFFKAVATATGYDMFCYQMSSRDQSEHRRGERTYYWARDTSLRPQDDMITSTDMVTMIDVDYYVDMPSFLMDHPQPTCVFTTVPDVAAKTTPEYSYSFNSHSELCWNVRGGGSFQHPLWNFCPDWFTVSRLWSLDPTTVVYHTTVRRVSEDKACVLLVPARVYKGLFAVLVAAIGRPLERLSTYVGGGFTKVRRRDENGVNVSVARVGEETSATVPVDVFNTVRATQRVSPNNKIAMFSVKSIVKDVAGFDLHRAAILTDYLNNAMDGHVPDLYAMPQPQMVAFSFVTPEPEDKPVMVAFCDPLIPPAFVPMNNPATCDRAIDGRVKIPQQTARELLTEFKMTPKKQDAVHAFVTRLLPKAGTLVPLTFEEVSARQQKPSQKQDMVKASFVDSVRSIVTSFIKKEAYGKPTDPRNITTFPADVKARYAAFIYPLMDYVKQFPFYAFGRSPKKVAERVAEIATKCANRLSTPDLSRMDGHVELFPRTLERCILYRAFDETFHDEVEKCHDEAFGNTGITADGTRYEQGFSRGSGSMETSLFNTLDNLFIIFYAFVLSGKTFDEAWQALSDYVVAGGDDSVVGELAPAFLITAAQHCGFVLLTDTFVRGQVGVNFLARIYGPHVWDGDTNSMCQPKRQLEKLHLTPQVPLSQAQKMFEKATSFNLTDSQTPVIGHWCRAVNRVCKGFTSTGTLARFGDEYAPDEQYPNTYSEWMDQVINSELSLVDVESLKEYLDSAQSIKDLLEVRPFYEAGREYTYPDWDPTPGLLVKRTLEALKVSPKTNPRAQVRAAVSEIAAAEGEKEPDGAGKTGRKKKKPSAPATTSEEVVVATPPGGDTALESAA